MFKNMLKNITYFPTFKDFDKPVNDIINDDFESKYLLKIKTPGPKYTIFNTQIQLENNNQLNSKVSLKLNHPSGFAIDKLEAANNKITIESSFSDLAPGLKLEFKGENQKNDLDLGFTYKHPLFTLTSEADIQKQSYVKFSCNSGNGPVTIGGAVDLKLEKNKLSDCTYSLGGGYTIPRQVFVGIRTEKKFTDHNVTIKYFASPELTLAGKVGHNSKGISGTIVGVYRCNPNTIMKVKVNNLGNTNISLKQNVESKFTVTATAAINKDFKNPEFGLIANIG